MKVEKKGNTIVLTLPADWDSQNLTGSGKSFTIASSGGAQKIGDLGISVNVNVYKKNPAYVKPTS